MLSAAVDYARALSPVAIEARQSRGPVDVEQVSRREIDPAAAERERIEAERELAYLSSHDPEFARVESDSSVEI